MSIKYRCFAFYLSVILELICQVSMAQIAQTNSSTNGISSSFFVKSAGPHSRVWQMSAIATNSDGMVHTNIVSYTELGTGLNHESQGQWISSTEDIQIQPDGSGAATNCQHKVYFSANINTQSGITLITPNGRTLSGNVLGLSLYDSSSGSNAIIANLQNSIGQILGGTTNQVLYTNALADPNSSFTADVLYTHKLKGFEQDVVLHHQIPDPASLGLNPQFTSLQVWTEYHRAFDPATNAANGNSLATVNPILNFGTMQMDKGNAFASDSLTNTADQVLNGGTLLVPIIKHWVKQNGRKFLVEEVPLQSIAAQLQILPAPTHYTNGTACIMSPGRFFRDAAQPKGQMAGINNERLQYANMGKLTSAPSLVMDYVMNNNNFTNFTFQGDTTYYVSGTVNLYGTTTLEGGAVIKGGLKNENLTVINGNVVCKTSPYHPAIFTTATDNSVGITLGSNTTPSLATSTYLYILKGGTVSNVHFCYGWNGISGNAPDIQISDCQFFNCSHAVTINSSTTNLGLHNVLFTMDNRYNNTTNFCCCQSGALVIYSTAAAIYGEHITADLGTQNFIMYNILPATNATTFAFTNCIVITPRPNPWYTYGNRALAIPVTTNNSYYASSAPTNLFRAVGAGYYYLATNSPARNIGTTNINPTVLADIASKTTYPPLVLSNLEIATNLVLSPSVQRDSGAGVDAGYHYVPLDYAIGGGVLGTNHSLSIQPGTAIACFGINSNNFGISVGPHSSFVSQGAANNLVHITSFNSVQEQSINKWFTPSYFILPAVQNTVSTINCRFTDF